MDEKIMQRWDEWRKYISEEGTASWPRDEFENLISGYEEHIKELVREKKLCEVCFQLLEPDGSCLTCRMAEKVKELEEGIQVIINSGYINSLNMKEKLKKLIEKEKK